MPRLLKLAIFALSSLALSSISNAALINRGNGMIYDTTLNITWLQDFNYARTSGYDADGYMTWYQAEQWANGLAYGGFTDWRLPSANIRPEILQFSFDGSTDYGYNNTNSELGHLYHATLGNKSYYSSSGTTQSGYGLVNSGPFQNFYYGSKYWMTGDYIYDQDNYGNFVTNSDLAWLLFTANGFQFAEDKVSPGYGPVLTVAVRDGDVLPPAVPVPASAWLFGSALLGLATSARKRLSK